MKVVFGINSFDNGGAENFMLRLAAYFQQNGHQLCLFSLNKANENQLKRLENNFGINLKNAKVIDIYTPSKIEDQVLWRINGLLNRIGIAESRLKYIIRKTVQRIEDFNPDVVNTHLFETDEFFSKYLNIPQVISMHGPYEYYLHKKSNDDGTANEKSFEKEFINEEFVERAKNVLAKCKGVIYCADKNLEILKHIDLKRLTKKKVFYGFERPVLTKPSKKGFTIGLFARGVESKGWEILIECYLRLKPRYADLSLKLIYNESDYMQRVKQKYQNTDINFHGYEPNLQGEIETLDLVVFPTYYPGESLPNTIIEALMFEVPVVSTNHAEVPFMIANGEEVAGIIVDINNLDFEQQVEEFSKAVRKYLDNPKLYKSHKLNCRNVASQFEMKVCYENYLDFFLNVGEGS